MAARWLQASYCSGARLAKQDIAVTAYPDIPYSRRQPLQSGPQHGKKVPISGYRHQLRRRVKSITFRPVCPISPRTFFRWVQAEEEARLKEKKKRAKPTAP
jgi:hypothetical protein